MPHLKRSESCCCRRNSKLPSRRFRCRYLSSLRFLSQEKAPDLLKNTNSLLSFWTRKTTPIAMPRQGYNVFPRRRIQRCFRSWELNRALIICTILIGKKGISVVEIVEIPSLFNVENSRIFRVSKRVQLYFFLSVRVDVLVIVNESYVRWNRHPLRRTANPHYS